MARDIEEFLRRAAERRQQQKNAQQRPPANEPIEIVEPEIVERPPPRRQPASQSKPRTKQQQRQQEMLRQRREQQRREQQRLEQQRDMRNESIDQHVGRHLDTSDIAQHADGLGAGIAGAHDRIDSAIHLRLDHDVSKIDDRPTITDDPRQGVIGRGVAPLAAELLKMLAGPRSIQQAILVKEVLERRDFDQLDDEL